MSKDRRKFERKDIKVPVLMNVRVKDTRKRWTAYSRDISIKSIFIETEQPFRTINGIELTFHMPGSKKKVSVKGNIVRKIARKKKSMGKAGVGFALEFTDVDPAAIGEIQKFIAAAGREFDIE